MLLFHGTRKKFEKFDPAFFRTGEFSVGVGFYFTDNLKGACAHATNRAPRPGEPLVYVCEIREPALTLNIGQPISKQSPEAQEHWEKLPVAHYFAKEYHKDWFRNLFPKFSFGNLDPEPSDLQNFVFLRKHGFQVLFDTEGYHTDPYLAGPTIVVLDENIIDIIEVLPAEALIPETIGEVKKYELAHSLRELGNSGVLSYLRPINPDY